MYTLGRLPWVYVRWAYFIQSGGERGVQEEAARGVVRSLRSFCNDGIVNVSITRIRVVGNGDLILKGRNPNAEH